MQAFVLLGKRSSYLSRCHVWILQEFAMFLYRKCQVCLLVELGFDSPQLHHFFRTQLYVFKRSCVSSFCTHCLLVLSWYLFTVETASATLSTASAK